MAKLGVHIFEQATSLSTPKVAAVGIPFVVGTAPVHTAAKPAKPNAPVLATSWDEAVEKLGFSYDWKSYTLCEFMYSHFQLYGCQPVIFCNVLDAEQDTEELAAQKYQVTEHQAALPFEAMLGGLTVKKGDEGAALTPEEDYTLMYDSDGGKLIVELLEGGRAYEASELNVSGRKVKPSAVEQTDIVEGLAAVDACLSGVGVLPDLIAAPGWSHNGVIAAVMATKAAAINGLFQGKAVVDVDSGESGVKEYSELLGWKNRNSVTDPAQILCWPMVQLGDYRFHLSTQLCGLLASVDAGNRGVPYESPSNKNLKMDACVLEDGAEVSLTWNQVEQIAGAWGIVTAVNFLDQGWVAKGNYTACYPASTDVKDQFIPVSRMFDYIGNTIVRTFWGKLDKPMTTALRDSILQTCNIWLGGLTGGGYLYGARAELLAEENPTDKLLDGIITLHVYNAPPVPAQEIDFILEYDISYMEAALTA